MNSQHITGYIKKLAGYGVLVLTLLMLVSIVRNIGKVARIRGEVEIERQKIEKMKRENEELERQIDKSKYWEKDWEEQRESKRFPADDPDAAL